MHAFMHLFIFISSLPPSIHSHHHHHAHRSRDRRHRSRSRGRDHDRRRRSRSRSRSAPKYDPDRKRRRPTWFDIPPVGGAPPPISQLPGAVQVTPEVIATAGIGGGIASGPNQQATRHARRIYMGGLPPSAHEDTISDFLSNALAAVGGTTAGPGTCCVNVYVNHDKKFAFVELRTVEEASNAMALDGILFEGATVRIRRPADYNPVAAAALGPAAPNPNLNLAAIGLEKPAPAHAGGMGTGAPHLPAPTTLPNHAATRPEDDDTGGSQRLFIGGLPYYLKISECKELLSSFGAIKSFDLIIDRATGDSKGYGFVVYEDPTASDAAIAGLHGMKMGDRQLTVKPAEGIQRTAQPVAPAVALADGVVQPAMFTIAAPRVVKLIDALKVEELVDDEDYADIVEDMAEELGKYGKVLAVHIPRPSKEEGADPPRGLGKVLGEFEEPTAALAARNALHGRKFGGNIVQASLVTEEDFKAGNWD